MKDKSSESTEIQFRRNIDERQLVANRERQTSPSNFANIPPKEVTNVRNVFDTFNHFFDKHTSESTKLVVQHPNPPTDRKSDFLENKCLNTDTIDHRVMDQSDPIHKEGYTASNNPGVMKAGRYFGASNHYANQSVSELKNGIGTGVLGKKAGFADARLSGNDRNAVNSAENYKWKTQRKPLNTPTHVCSGVDCLCSSTRPSKGPTFKRNYINFLLNQPHSGNFSSNNRTSAATVEHLKKYRHPNPSVGQMEMSNHHGKGKKVQTSVPIPHRGALIPKSNHTSLIRQGKKCKDSISGKGENARDRETTARPTYSVCEV